MILDIGIYQLDVDVERTAQFYRSAEGIRCDCDGCRNYAKAVLSLPIAVQHFFQQFGIDPAKPAEVYVNDAPSANSVHYGGFYHVCGTVLKGTDPWIPVGNGGYILDEQCLIQLNDECSFFISSDRIDLLDEHFPKPVLQIEIVFILPWVLDKANPYLR